MTRPRLVAPVGGPLAIALVPGLDDALNRLRRAAAVTPELAAQLPEAVDQADAIRAAASDWLGWRTSVAGTAEAPEAEVPPDSELSTREAAVLIGCSGRWIRELVARGVLPAKRTAGRLLIRREDVDLIRR